MADGAQVGLDDKYDLAPGRAVVNGREALVRLLLVQRAVDKAAGLRTAGFVSGYRGSPLGELDEQLWRARDPLEANDITFLPGLNEDLAMTSVAGTQQIDFLPGAKVEGVFALWYGKGPGVDRSGDAIKHANLAGVSAKGGVVLAFGDDHTGKSSTTAHQSDLTLASWEVPVLYPSNVGEIVTYGLAAFAMSRFSGAVIGLKLVNETAEAASLLEWERPPLFIAPGPAGDVHVRAEVRAMLAQDARLVRTKLPAAQAFARANRLDGIIFGAPAPRLLIATSGKALGDVLRALELLGIDRAAASDLGIGVYKIALLFPLEPEGLFEAAQAAAEIVFIEEKRAHAETQARALFYNRASRPLITGKTDADGALLFPADAPLDPALVATHLAARLKARFPDLERRLPGFSAAFEQARSHLEGGSRSALLAVRRPAFCPGCPHNTSTRVPEGSFGATGIGCHGMVLFHADRNPLPMGHMGAEGAQWIGLSRYSETPHIFQNLGDGTYAHSGSLAIRAAAAAGVNITYKILYNDAVAMTGGQPVEGALTVGRIVEQVRAEGVAKVVVVAEYPARFDHEPLPAGVDVRHRDDLAAVQEDLRRTPGVTVLVYDQVCAAEKRRRRKAGDLPDPDRRVFINAAVCEGCGDCSVQSNCLAIQPLETELGRKRRIDQSACNKDFTCIKGFCPSFVIVEGARPRRQTTAVALASNDELPAPVLEPIGRGYNILISGVGGTGVISVAAILGMAASIEGLGVGLYDMTGLSQKGGAVFSHVRLLPDPSGARPARIGPSEADLLLACDLVAAAQPEALQTLRPGGTRVIVNADATATADFQLARDLTVPVEALLQRLAAASGGRPSIVAASSLAAKLLGDSIGANILMLGYAWQAGAIPLSLSAMEAAIRLNGQAIEANLRAFHQGRRAALMNQPVSEEPIALSDFIARRTRDLEAYWSRRYADRYASLMDDVTAATAIFPGGQRFAWAVARSAYKLMAYKDEYEVARLYTDGRFRQALADELVDIRKMKVMLSPPLLASPDPRTGRPGKIAFGAWVFPVLQVLARVRGLRESALDPFARTPERRLERRLRDAFLSRMASETSALGPATIDAATALAEAALEVRGFGVVKEAAAHELLARLR